MELETLTENNIRARRWLPVVNRDRRLVGIIELGDNAGADRRWNGRSAVLDIRADGTVRGLRAPSRMKASAVQANRQPVRCLSSYQMIGTSRHCEH